LGQQNPAVADRLPSLMNPTCSRRLALLTMIALLGAGCGARVKVTPVTGKVTLDGKPLAGAHVSFQPQSSAGKQEPGVGSYGLTDSNGNFELKLTDSDKPGAVVGQHRVEINIRNDSSDDGDPRLRAAQPRLILPAKYNRLSELKFDVKPGAAAEAKFDLLSQ
jgi:hypothetical protein